MKAPNKTPDLAPTGAHAAPVTKPSTMVFTLGALAALAWVVAGAQFVLLTQ